MADKYPIGSKESIRRFVKHKERWAVTWIVMIAFNAVAIIYSSMMLGIEGFTWWRTLCTTVFGSVTVIEIVFYGTTRERIIFGKIMYANGVSVKIDEDGNTVSEVHMEKAEKKDGEEHEKITKAVGRGEPPTGV